MVGFAKSHKNEILDFWAAGLTSRQIAIRLGMNSRGPVLVVVMNSRSEGDARAHSRPKPFLGKRKEIVAARTVSNRRWQEKFPEKRAAHKAVENAIKTGKLSREGCEICGGIVGIHAHHDDYSKPLSVRWLCPAHHQERHREMVCIAA